MTGDYINDSRLRMVCDMYMKRKMNDSVSGG